jgi:hypothetical protein
VRKLGLVQWTALAQHHAVGKDRPSYAHRLTQLTQFNIPVRLGHERIFVLGQTAVSECIVSNTGSYAAS